MKSQSNTSFVFSSPLQIFLQVLLIVFVAEAGVMFLLPVVVSTKVTGGMLAVLDASLLTVITAPILWRVIIRPLRRMAVSERMRAVSVIEAAADGIVTADDQGFIETFNAAAEQMFGYTAQDVIGQHIGRLVHFSDETRSNERVTQFFRELATRQNQSGVELEGQDKDHRVFSMWLTVSEIEFADKRLFTAIVRDLTEQKQMEMQRRQQDLARAEQMAMVAHLATGVAHEIRNPLTSIKLLVQNNREEFASRGAPEEDLEIIEREILRMERSLASFLEFARPSKPASRRFDLAKVVDQTFLLVEGRAFRQSVVCVKTGIHDGSLMVNADYDKIQQLLLNLVLNALDAMPSGGTLEIYLGRATKEMLEIRVVDSGPGIAASVLPRLFEPFVTTKETGVGIGLAISYRIAQESGGDLSARNEPDGGACLVLNLPVSQF